MAKTVTRRGPIRAFAQILFPHFCIVCKKEGSVLCDRCVSETAAKMTRGVLFDGGMAMSYYHDVTQRTLLQMYKYDGIEEAGEALEKLFRLFLTARRDYLRAQFFDSGDVTVMPVPLHWFRERLRGFNQADRFARITAEACGNRYTDRVLVRRVQWQRQATITDDAVRKKNAAHSVMVRPDARVSGTVVLIDDVYTTGATIRACEGALKQVGAARVCALTLLTG